MNNYCTVCSKQLEPKQRKFCGISCRNKHYNKILQSYSKQKTKSIEIKLSLINKLGGKCSICNYNKNISALCFHHKNPSQKEFHLDLRSLANRQLSEIEKEVGKCILLCQNCHLEIHHPQSNYNDLSKSTNPKFINNNQCLDRRCLKCGRKISRGSRGLCASCYKEESQQHGRKTFELPSREDLIEMLKTSSKLQLAKELKTSTHRLSRCLDGYEPVISNKICIVCGKELTGKQIKFCSIKCKGKNISSKYHCSCHEQRATARKMHLIDSFGGKCASCGYQRNISALCFHHRDPSQKNFSLSRTVLSRKTFDKILQEAQKCELLCHNCHNEIHYPDLEMNHLQVLLQK